MKSRPARRLAEHAVLGIILGLAAAASHAQPMPAGTYRATSADGARLDVRVGDDGAVEFFSPADGARATARPLMRTARGTVALLANGEVAALGGTPPQLSLAGRLFALAPIPPAAFAAPAAPQNASASSGTAGPGSALLAGVKLSVAKSGNGWGEEHRYTFCHDGSFSHFTQFLSLSQFGRGNTARTERGSWQIVSQGGQDVLQLRFLDGRIERGAIRRTAPDVIAIDGRGFAAERAAC